MKPQHNRLLGIFGGVFLLLANLFLIQDQATASSEGQGKKFDPGEMILGHVTDAYSWHVCDWNGHPVSISLPVILYHEERGLTLFSSSRFDHGHSAYKGYKLGDSGVVALGPDGKPDQAATAQLWDLSITKNVAAILFSLALMLVLFISVAKRYQKRGVGAPKGFQSWIEPLIVFVRDEIAVPTIGREKYSRFMPFLLTAFFFIWLNNLLGLIPFPPGGANVTGSISVTMALAAMTFIITTFNGNKHYWRHIFAMPGVPVGVLPILSLVEFIGIFLKPFVLMIRLYANILAGHIVLLSFFSLIFLFAEMNAGVGLGVSVVSVAFTVFMTLLKLLVAFIQAYVFTFLSSLYFGMATEEAH